MVALRHAAGVAALLMFQVQAKNGKPLKEIMPWYHSTEEIHTELSDVVEKCKAAGLNVERSPLGESSPDLEVLRFRGGDTSKTPSVKAFFVFGEHARELISPESALDFAHTLCGRGPNAAQARSTLESVEFIVVPNANPVARKQVEGGSYCKRTNENGVDLNRNWGDEHRQAKVDKLGQETYPGPAGFSEPETQALRDLVSREKPDVYLSVHSGAYLLGAPYGYKKGNPENEDDIDQILKPISEKHCNGECPYGGLADMLGYNSDGCDIDWVSEDAGVQYAFTWEIYTGEQFRTDYAKKANAQAHTSDSAQDSLDSPSFAQRSAKRRIRSAGRRQSLRGAAAGGAIADDNDDDALDPIAEVDEDPDGCIYQFMPTSQEDTERVVENWTGAYLDLAAAVAARRASSARPAAAGDGGAKAKAAQVQELATLGSWLGF